MKKKVEFGKATSFSKSALKKWRGKAVSSLGYITEDQRVIVSGHDVLNDLLGEIDLPQALYLFIKRRIPDKNVAELLKCLVVAVNYPDIRVWPIAAVAFAAAAGVTPGTALGVGMLGIEATLFGNFAILEAYSFLEEIQSAIEKGENPESRLDELLQSGKTAFGYGRPLTRKDERVPAVLRAVENLGFAGGKWLGLALRVEEILFSKKKLKLNFGGLTAALLKDRDFSPEEVETFSNFLPIINFLGVCHEHANSVIPIFPLSCEDIEYSGPEIKE